MSQIAKRRKEANPQQKELDEIYLSTKPPIARPFIKLWMKMWRAIYYLVSMITYLGLIAGVGVTAYWSFIEISPLRAILGGLCTLLIIYVNKVNPS